MAGVNSGPKWKKGKVIGGGTYGTVYKGMNIDSGEIVAIKELKIGGEFQENIEVEKEVNLLGKLSHANIVRYIGIYREQHALNILLEIVPCGSIKSLLDEFGPFTEPVIRTYTKQLLHVLEYLHIIGIIHRDIKGENILVGNKGCIKLSDFGASKQLDEKQTTGAKSWKGTPNWMAPEIIRQTGHGLSADIWSLGCTIIEMATGMCPWGQKFTQAEEIFFHVGMTSSHPPIPDHVSSEAKKFLLKCFEKEPNLRGTATELLQHPFVVGDPDIR